MKGHAAMADRPEPADARRALLAKYMRGELPQGALAAGGSTLRRQIRATPLLKAAEAEGAPDARVRLVPIQTSGSRRPIFYVHVHSEGGAFYCFTLARDLGADQPLYLLEPYCFDGLRIPPPLEAMAATYIESLHSVQPEGPYRLVAFCGGSPIAFEMAQQLRAAGQAVDLAVCCTSARIRSWIAFSACAMRTGVCDVRAIGRASRSSQLLKRCARTGWACTSGWSRSTDRARILAR